jgi:phospholipid/cholesterol/gamma-HCH transport system ATP-binding protein
VVVIAVDCKLASVSYLNQVILKDIEFRLEAGRYLGILGPSGIGKSTILRVISGFHEEFEGTCSVFGNLVSEVDLTVLRQGMSFLFQKSPLLEDMSIFDNLMLSLFYLPGTTQEKSDNIMRVLVKLNLDHVAEHFPDQLSGGMRRRVVLAATVLRKPKLLLCDEPFTGQDPITKASLVNMLSELGQEFGFAMILVSHDVKETLSLCHESIVLMEKTVKVRGGSQDILRSDLPMVHAFLDGTLHV